MSVESGRRDRRLPACRGRRRSSPNWWPSSRWRTSTQFPKSESEARRRTGSRDALRAEGFQDVALLDTPDGTQSVYGFLPGPEGAKTVLLYAHYDVQPPLDESGWVTPPFELTERDGRWYGRGAADCKGGVIMHLLALRALKANGGVPVNVKVIAEGSEEQGTGGLRAVRRGTPRAARRRHDRHRRRRQLPGRSADGHRDAARYDHRSGSRSTPSRATCTPASSAAPRPDALGALIRVLDSLRAEDGSTTVDGLTDDGVVGRTAVRRGAVPQGRQGARRCGADRLRHGRRPDLGASGGHRPRHRLPAGGRRHPVRAGERPRAGQPAGAAGRGRGGGDQAAGGASGGAHAVGRAGAPSNRSARASRSAPTPPARRTRRWPRRWRSRTRARRCSTRARAARSRCATPSRRSTRRPRSC